MSKKSGQNATGIDMRAFDFSIIKFELKRGANHGKAHDCIPFHHTKYVETITN